MKYKLIIFDFDGTLADSFPWFLSVADQIADKYKLKRPENSDIEYLRNLDTRGALKSFGVPVWKTALIGRHVKQLMADDIQNIPLFEGIDDLLKYLSKSGVRLALVSSNSIQNVRKVLGDDLADLFEFFECGVSLLGKKAKFCKILKKSGVRQDEAFCIGDETRDIQAARQAGIPAGAVSWGYASVPALAALEPNEIFSTVSDIFEMITSYLQSEGHHPSNELEDMVMTGRNQPASTG